MNRNRVSFCAGLLLCLWVLTSLSFAQSTAAPRITRTVNDSDVALLPGGVHPHVARSLDQGSVSASMTMQRMAIFFKPSAAQQEIRLQFIHTPKSDSWPTAFCVREP